jgi:hypothetical protein
MLLERLHSTNHKVTTMTYEDAIGRAEMAAQFVEDPYWAVVSRMLSGTIQSETEALLSSDEHREVNRASVAIARKVLQMPYFDIEQGRLAQATYEKAKSQQSRNRRAAGYPGAYEV